MIQNMEERVIQIRQQLEAEAHDRQNSNMICIGLIEVIRLEIEFSLASNLIKVPSCLQRGQSYHLDL